MGRVTDETKDRIRSEVDFADLLGRYTRTPKPGINTAMWFCPFHNDVRKPAMRVTLDQQRWHCFVCDTGGDIFQFVMDKEGMDYKEAVRFLCDQYGIEYKEEGGTVDAGRSLYQVIAEAERFFRDALAESPEAQKYLADRCFTPETIETWHIGWAPGRGSLRKHLESKGFTLEEMKQARLVVQDGEREGQDFFYNRVIFPIANAVGKPIAFGGRVLGDGTPKYLNSVDSPIFHKGNTIFGLHVARKHIGQMDAAIVVEGYVDDIMMQQAGIPNSVATLGTAFTRENLANLARLTKNIYLALDNDAAGLAAAKRIAEALDGSSGASVFALTLPREAILGPDGEPLTGKDGNPVFVKDADDYFNRAGHTAEDYGKLLEAAPGILSFVAGNIVRGYDLSKPNEKEKAYNEAAEFIRENRDAVSAFQVLDACELLVKLLDLGVTGYELSTQLSGSGSKVSTPVSAVRQGIDSSIELNVLRLLVDNPKKHRTFERDVTEELFQDPANWALFQRALEAINAREDINNLHFDDEESERAWTRFLMTHPATGFDEVQADQAIERNINALRKARLKALIEQMEAEEDPDYDRLFALKMEFAKIR